jgi:hypothetical protein
MHAMPRKRKVVPYEGVLAKPIQETSDEASAKREWMRRFFLLFEFYDINRTTPEAFLQLASALAREHVPGLKFDLKPGPGGRKLEWTERRKAALAIAVDELKQRGHARSDRQACEQLVAGRHASEWKPPATYQGTSEKWQKHLRNMASKGRKTWVYAVNSNIFLRMMNELITSDLPTEPCKLGPTLDSLLRRTSF